MSKREVFGPAYYRSFAKREYDAKVARAFQPAAMFLMRLAHNSLAIDVDSKLIFTQPRFGVDVLKIQTLDRQDYDSPEAAEVAKQRMTPSVKLTRSLAIDELPQVFQVSIDPAVRGALGMTGARPLMVKDRFQYKKSIGSVRYAEIVEVERTMGYGVYSLYGIASREAMRSGDKTPTAIDWMQRYDMDLAQCENGCEQLDDAILQGALAMAGLRIHALENGGKLPAEIMPTLLSYVGMTQ